MAVAEEVLIELKQRGAQQVASDMDRVGHAGRGMGQGIAAGANAGTAAVAGLTKILAPLLAALAAIKAAETALTFNSMRQNSEIAFETMLGSAEQAKQMVSDIVQFAATTPFEVKGLTEATQKLLAFGFQAKDVLPMLQTVGDAMAGLGMGAEGIDRAVRALGQMGARGKVTSQEMMQLTELGIPAWKALADAIGTDTGTAMGMVEAGAVDAATGINAVLDLMDTKFGGLMEKQAHTLGGLASTIKDTFAQTIGAVAEPAVRRLTAAMEKITEFTGTDEFKQWVAGAAQAVDDLLTGLGPAVQFLTQDVPQAFSAIGDAIHAFASGDFSRLEGMFAGWAEAASGWIADAQNQIGDKADELLTALGAWIDANGPALEKKVTEVWVPAFVDWTFDLGGKIVKGLEAELPKITDWIADKALPAIAQAMEDLLNGVQKAVAKKGIELHHQIRNSIEQALRPEGGAVGGSWGGGGAVGGDWGPAADAAAAEAAARAARSAPSPMATTRLQRGYITSPTNFTPKADQEKQKAEKAVETAIDGFMSALQANRADMLAQFGTIGADGASALATAFAQNTSASGGSLARAMESLVIQAQEAGIENWRGLGNDLADAFHDALTQRTEAAQQRALTMLTDVSGQVAGAKAEKAAQESLQKAGDAFRDAADKADTQIQRLVEAFDASEELRDAMDRMNEELRQGLEKMQATQQRITDQIQGGRSDRDLTRQYGREDLLSGEGRQQAQSDFNRSSQRRLADLQRQYADRVRDIQRGGGPNVGQQMTDAARQYQEQVAEQARQVAQQRADMIERFALEDRNRERARQWAAEDRAQRMADLAADKERAKANEGALTVERARLEAPIKTRQELEKQKSLAEQIKSVEDSKYETLKNITAELEKQNRLITEQYQKQTGRPFGGGGDFDAGETVEIEEVQMDGERVGTLTARHTVNHVATHATVMGGA